MMIGTVDLNSSSGFNTPIEQIPTPLFAVPYAAPRSSSYFRNLTGENECASNSNISKEFVLHVSYEGSVIQLPVSSAGVSVKASIRASTISLNK